MRTTRAWTGVVAAAALVLAACSAGPDDPPGPGSGSEPSASHSTGQDGTATPEAVALRPGERFLDLAMPSPYVPSAPSGGTDDYRCFLLDPGTDEDAFVTGVDVVPGNRDVVHHVILFRVPPAQVAAAERTGRVAVSGSSTPTSASRSRPVPGSSCRSTTTCWPAATPT